MSFLIRYNDGSYNYGPEGTPVNGFPTGLTGASRYSSREIAEKKAQNLSNDDASPVEIIESTQVSEEELRDPVTDHHVLRWLYANLVRNDSGFTLPSVQFSPGADKEGLSYSEFFALLSEKASKNIVTD